MKKHTDTTNALGKFMIDTVKSAIRIARKEAALYTKIPKVHYDGEREDLATSADLKAQAMYQRRVNKHYPTAFFVAEEGYVEGKNSVTEGERFVCDPVDGTKAYDRGQSTGVATLFEHVTDEDIDAVCVGDVNTGEIYHFDPDTAPTRIRFGVQSLLPTEWKKPLGALYAVLDNHPDEFPGNIRTMIRTKYGGIFKDMEVTSGSRAILLTRLWKQEIGMVVMAPSYITPWDATPVIGMNRKLSIVHIKVDITTGRAEPFTPPTPTAITRKDYVEIFVHRKYEQEVLKWLNSHPA